MKSVFKAKSHAKTTEWKQWWTVSGIAVAVLFLWWMCKNRGSLFNVSCLVPWETITDQNLTSKICVTSLSDANVDSIFSKHARRDFSNVLEAGWSNKVHYTEKYGYRLINGSHLVDTSRPPAWSKILAAKDALKQGCEWVFWMDPDSLIMNSKIRIEDIIPANQDAGLVITKDVTGFNAGIWLVRNDPWANEFLDRWWKMGSYVRGPGDTKSGDNDALKVLLNGFGPDDQKHLFIPLQCSMNSYLWVFSLKAVYRYCQMSNKIKEGQYRPGQFILHFGGLDDKMKYLNKMKAYAS